MGILAKLVQVSLMGRDENMNDAKKMEAKLVGPDKVRLRRAGLLADLGKAFAESGPQAVTAEMTRRMDILIDAFADHLQQLKKQL
jgi:hypothetical protein